MNQSWYENQSNYTGWFADGTGFIEEYSFDPAGDEWGNDTNGDEWYYDASGDGYFKADGGEEPFEDFWGTDEDGNQEGYDMYGNSWFDSADGNSGWYASYGLITYYEYLPLLAVKIDYDSDGNSAFYYDDGNELEYTDSGSVTFHCADDDNDYFYNVYSDQWGIWDNETLSWDPISEPESY